MTPEERARIIYEDVIDRPYTSEKKKTLLLAFIRAAEDAAAERVRHACEMKAADKYVLAEPMTIERSVARSIGDAIRALDLATILGRKG